MGDGAAALAAHRAAVIFKLFVLLFVIATRGRFFLGADSSQLLVDVLKRQRRLAERIASLFERTGGLTMVEKAFVFRVMLDVDAALLRDFSVKRCEGRKLVG